MTNENNISLTFNFAEANAKSNNMERLFRDYAERRFLVGYLRPKNRKWFNKTHLYNVRPEEANRRGGVNEKNPFSDAIDYVILYKNSKAFNRSNAAT